MDRYKRYYGVGIFLLVVCLCIYGCYSFINPKVTELNNTNSSIERKYKELTDKKNKKSIVENKIKKIQDSITGSRKKVYAPSEADLGNDTLFFTLYNDLIEMIHASSIKIKSINYTYNPGDDAFVKFGKDSYFVSDVNLEIISNYTDLGKFIQDIYQYPYYIKINKVEVIPYAKDKKILLTYMSIRLYSRTEPQDDIGLPNS